VSVELRVVPVDCDFARHTLYAVSGNYSLCPNCVHSDQVLKTAQLVYDTYIRVTPLSLRHLYCQKPSQFYNSARSLIVTSLERHLPDLAPEITQLNVSRPEARNAPELSHRRGSEIPSFPTITSVACGRKRLHGSDDSGAETETESSAETETNTPTTSRTETESSISAIRTRKQRLDKLVKSVIWKVKRGQAGRKRREDKIVGVFGVDDAVSQCLLHQENDEHLDNCLDQVEEALEELIRGDETHIIKRKTWGTWFHLANLRIVRELRRKGRKHRPSIAAKLVNRIVNYLLVSDGQAAWGVYDGLSGKESAFMLLPRQELTDHRTMLQSLQSGRHDPRRLGIRELRGGRRASRSSNLSGFVLDTIPRSLAQQPITINPVRASLYA
jgi:hypothetical protein